jgi:hypothetical protein
LEISFVGEQQQKKKEVYFCEKVSLEEIDWEIALAAASNSPIPFIAAFFVKEKATPTDHQMTKVPQ